MHESGSGTTVWTGRALQAESDDLEVIGLALLYPALERNVCVLGHHGYSRASDLILGKALKGRSCHQITDATGDTVSELAKSCAPGRIIPIRIRNFPTVSNSSWGITLIRPCIVLFAAGGGTDVSARTISEHMSRTLGQQIVIENIVGAGGTTGSTRAMRAAPDGFTIERGQMGTHATAVALYPYLAYKPDIDFAPIGLVHWAPVMIVARKDFPPKDLREFVAYVKANAQKLNVAHAGVGLIGFSCRLQHRQVRRHAVGF